MALSTVGLDSTTLVLILALGLGGLGMKRGIRTEGITLAGVLGAAIVYSNEAMRERLVQMVNQIPRIFDMLLAPDTTSAAAASAGVRWFQTADEKLVFYVLLFFVSVVLFYFLGSKYGNAPVGKAERLIGGIMGAVSGFAIGSTVVGFGQSYLSRHPGKGGVASALPTIQTPSLPAGSLAQYAPLVFLVAVGVVAGLAISSFRKAKQ